MKCRKCNLAERHEQLAYCLPCNAAYLKEYRERKKAKMEEPAKDCATELVEKYSMPAIEKFRAEQKIVPHHVDPNHPLNNWEAQARYRKNGADILYVHTRPNPKIKRCQAGKDGGACPNVGMLATVGEYKAWLCFAHSSMGKFVEA